jgi:D-alanyl-D-alanine carboxypeptidase
MTDPAIAADTARLLQAEMERSLAADASLPGIIATVHAPRIGLRWSGACGHVRRGGDEALTPDHAFRIASCTKPYTAAVALRLVEQGRLDPYAPLDPLLDDGTLAMLTAGGYEPAHITVYHLLTHSSGLRDHGGRDSGFGEAVQRDPAHVWTHAEQIAFCMSLGDPLCEPGTRFSYSDTAYMILGDLLERVAGQRLHQLMRELLHFERLGLAQTHFERHEPAPANQRRAGQLFDGIDVASFDCSCDLSGGGGLIATTDELARFYRAAVLGELFERRETLPLALATPSLVFTPPADALHAPLMRGVQLGRERAWVHTGFWGVGAGFCPASDISLAWSVQQVHAGESTLGEPGNPARPGLGARLALIAQQAVAGH